MDRDSSEDEDNSFETWDQDIQVEVTARQEYPNLDLENSPDVEQTEKEVDLGWTSPPTEDESAAASYHFEPSASPLTMEGTSRTPIDFFNALFDERMWNQLSGETNRYAAHKRASMGSDAFSEANHENFRPFARLNKWTETNPAELKVWVAHLIVMGLIRKPEIESYWSGDGLTRTPFFGQHMARDRFTALMSNFHVDNDSDNPRYDPKHLQNGHDPLAKLRSFVTMMDRNFKFVYKPKKEISVDEATCPYR